MVGVVDLVDLVANSIAPALKTESLELAWDIWQDFVLLNFLRFKNLIYVHVCMPHVCRCLWRPEEAAGYPEVQIPDILTYHAFDIC